jgi:IS30 family transposase
MYKHLTKEQRYYIELEMSNNVSISKISKKIKVHPSTLYRELRRNLHYSGHYYHKAAQGMAEVRKFNAGINTKFAKFVPKVLKYIILKLNAQWSPEQISGRMIKDVKVKISHKTIYKYIYKDRDNGGKLFKLLPHRGKKYKYGSSKKSPIQNRIDISKRPKIVDLKTRIGDFEADTIVGIRGGSKNCLLTMVDRKTKFTFIRKLPDKTAYSVQAAIENIHSETTIPFITITPDNGTEFSNHQQIAENIGCNFYFARPYRSCDRGLNEHTNGKIRYFVPKKTDFKNVSDDTIAQIQDNLNHRPRKVLGFLTPNEVMARYLNRINRKLLKCRTSP